MPTVRCAGARPCVQTVGGGNDTDPPDFVDSRSASATAAILATSTGLAASIAELGLLHPVVITPDGDAHRGRAAAGSLQGDSAGPTCRCTVVDH